MTDLEKRIILKEIIESMNEMGENERQFLLGYVAGVSARRQAEEAGKAS